MQDSVTQVQNPQKEKIKQRATITQNSSQLNSLTSEAKINSDEKRSQWEELMRKFSDDCKTKDATGACCMSFENMRCELQPLKTFWTGSSYHGTWDDFGMSGYGIYTYPDGAVYEGEFEDDVFHGEGILRYPNGMSVRGTWSNGVLIESTSTIVCADGVAFREQDWQYCKRPDRRYSIEYARGLQPAGRTFLAAEAIRLEIPKRFYDCSDGFFDPKSNTVYDYKNLSKAVRVPGMTAREWIMSKCRTSDPIEPLGPQPQLYEEWVKPIYDYENPPPLPENFTEREFLRTFMSPSYQDVMDSTIFKPQPSVLDVAMPRSRRQYFSFDSGFVDHALSGDPAPPKDRESRTNPFINV